MRQWIASTSCSTSSCGGAGANLYDPSTSTPSTDSFSLNYLRGSVTGDIVWDAVELGGYNITRQALGPYALSLLFRVLLIVPARPQLLPRL